MSSTTQHADRPSLARRGGATLATATLLAVFVSAFALALPRAAHAERALKSKDHQTVRGSLKLNIYEKWSASEEGKWKQNGKVILLVHGATWSSHCTFDPMPGYSLMDVLAQEGWDVWAVDLHGYGASGKTDQDWSEAASTVADVEAAADYIRAYRWVEKVHVLGYQWGAQVAGLFAQHKPHKVTRLVLVGMRYQLADKKTPPTMGSRTNVYAQAMLKPEDGDIEQSVARKRAEVCMTFDPMSPNGAVFDLNKKSSVDPGRITSPTLLIHGQNDGDHVADDDRLAFFKGLGTDFRWYMTLPGLGKQLLMEKRHERFERAVLSFLELP